MAQVIRGVNNESVQDGLYCYNQRDVDEYWRRGESRRNRYSDDFRNRVEETFSKVRSSRIYRATLASVRRLKNVGRPDSISQLSDIGMMQNASPIMQRLIMSSPRLLKLYRAKQVEGYHGSWRDFNANAIGDTNCNYRQVFDGIAITEGERTYATSYALSDKDREEFTSMDLADVRISMANVHRMLDMGDDDPTSVWNAALSKA